MPLLAASRWAHWGAAALFASSGILICCACVIILVVADEVTLFLFAAVQSVGTTVLQVLILSMPKLFLVSLYEGEELTSMITTSYAYLAIFRYGPLQFGFTVFVFYTAGDEGDITTAVLVAVGACMAVLASIPCFSMKLRNSMIEE